MFLRLLVASGFGLVLATHPEPLTHAAAASLVESNVEQAPASRASRIRTTRLRANVSTDVDLDELWLVTDDNGRRRVTAAGNLPLDLVQRTEIVIDRRTNTYTAIRFTSDDRQDAKRLIKAYRALGIDLAEEPVAANLAAWREKVERKAADIKESVRTGVRIPQVAYNVRTCSPARAVAADDEAPTQGPAVGDGGQWQVQCQGAAYSDIQVWEPARYVYPVDHLTETSASAFWTHWEPRGTFAVVKDQVCWANPTTFIGTVWSAVNCYKDYTQQAHAFDVSATGFYVNSDFWFYFTGGQAVHPISVTATAGVGFSNGTAYWGNSYNEDATELISGIVQTFFLSSRIEGYAYETECHEICDPDFETITECETRPEAFHWDYDLCECRGAASPILIDVNKDGFDLTGPATGVRFDLLANQTPVQVSWTRAGSDDAFLVLDRNANGTIDSGAELFGNMTPQPVPLSRLPFGRKSTAEPNGFSALAVFDGPSDGGNGDGQITADDAVFVALRVWRDDNHDGATQAGELRTLQDAGIEALSLHYVQGKRKDEFGNVFRYKSRVTMEKDAFTADPLSRRAVDVFLSYILVR